MLTLENVMAYLEKAGHKITTQRRLLVETVLARETVFSARDVLHDLQTRYPSISFDTVYRNLNILAGAGFICEISRQGKEGSRYEVQSDDNHHHHLICQSCGRHECIDYCCMPDARMAASSSGFVITNHRVEFFGYCKDCRPQEK